MSDVAVTQEILARLDEKLDAFAEQLDDDERRVLAALLQLGVQNAAALVEEPGEPVAEPTIAPRVPLRGITAPLGLQVKATGSVIKQDVTVNKAKTADKAFNAMDAYIRG